MTDAERAHRARRNQTIAVLRAPAPLLPSPCAPVYLGRAAQSKQREQSPQAQVRQERKQNPLGNRKSRNNNASVRWFDPKLVLRNSMEKDAHGGSAATDRWIRELAAKRRQDEVEQPVSHSSKSSTVSGPSPRLTSDCKARPPSSSVLPSRPHSAWSTGTGRSLSEVGAEWRQRTSSKEIYQTAEPLEESAGAWAAEIMRIADRFVEDGKLTATELLTFLAHTRFHAFARWLSQGMRNWAAVDANHSGTLDQTELEEAISRFFEAQAIGTNICSTQRAQSAGAVPKSLSAPSMSSTAFQKVLLAQHQRILDDAERLEAIDRMQPSMVRSLHQKFSGHGGWAGQWLSVSKAGPPQGNQVQQRAKSAIQSHS